MRGRGWVVPVQVAALAALALTHPLLGRGGRDVADAEVCRVLLQRGQLRGAFGIGNRQQAPGRIEARGGRKIMVGNGERQIRAADGAASGAQQAASSSARGSSTWSASVMKPCSHTY